MISEVQREALALLAEVWALSPDVRLGQLFAHLGFLSEVHLDRGLGYIDDDELMSILHKHREELQARLQAQPNHSLHPTEAAISATPGATSTAAAPAGEL
ncbi:MAG: hypothetical protein L0Y71_06705 [Gemmataceae bacterium]|nr:hypothetical protein [Gemmataceae bacterium]